MSFLKAGKNIWSIFVIPIPAHIERNEHALSQLNARYFMVDFMHKLVLTASHVWSFKSVLFTIENTKAQKQGTWQEVVELWNLFCFHFS